MSERSARLRVFYVAPSDLTNERRNYNQVQRALFAPEDVTVRILVPRSARISVGLPANVDVRRAMLPGRAGFYAAELAALLTARLSRIDAVATTNSFESIPAWLFRFVGGYRWIADIWDTPHKHLVTYYASTHGFGARIRELAARAKVAMFRRALPQADLVVASACAEALDGYRIPRDRIRVFTNAIALDDLESPTADRTPDSICFVSSLFLRDRGVTTLAASVDELAARGRDVHVSLAGVLPQEIRSELDGLKARNRIDVLGAVSFEEAHALMRRSEIGVLPFDENEDLAHTQPVKLLEYMALGCVVVASDLPGFRQIVRAGEEALLVSPGDPHALADALEQVLTDPELRTRLRANAYRRVGAFEARTKVRSIYAEIGHMCRLNGASL